MRALYYTLLLSLTLLIGGVHCHAEEPQTTTLECGCELDLETNSVISNEDCPLNDDERHQLLIGTLSSDMIKGSGDQIYVDTSFDGWSSLPATIVSLITIIASLVTILGFSEMLRNIYKGRVSRECQKMIIIDLIRHFIINLAILEGIKLKMKSNERPEEGTFARFAILESDLELGRFTISDNNYDTIHELSLYMRNFNIMTHLAEKHFSEATSTINNEVLDNDIKTLGTRMHTCIKKLWEMQIRMGYGIMEERVGNYYIDSYQGLKRDAYKEYDELKNISIPMQWKEEEIKRFQLLHQPNQFFSHNLFRTIENIVSFAIRLVILIPELAYHMFDGKRAVRITWYKFCSHHRKPIGWRNKEIFSKYSDTFKNSIAARLDDEKHKITYFSNTTSRWQKRFSRRVKSDSKA